MIVVIGDVMIDRYIQGTIERISPEAPVPVLMHATDQAAAGGAANVAVNIVALGGQAELIGLIGADSDAEALQDLLLMQGVRGSRLVTDPGRPTTSKTLRDERESSSCSRRPGKHGSPFPPSRVEVDGGRGPGCCQGGHRCPVRLRQGLSGRPAGRRNHSTRQGGRLLCHCRSKADLLPRIPRQRSDQT